MITIALHIVDTSFQFIKESTPSDHTAQDREPVFTQILHIFIPARDSDAKWATTACHGSNSTAVAINFQLHVINL